jgi:hypothetical protein
MPSPIPEPPAFSVVRVSTDTTKLYTEPMAEIEAGSLSPEKLLRLVRSAEVGRVSVQLLNPGKQVYWMEKGAHSFCQSLPEGEIRSWQALAACRHDDVAYALEFEGGKNFTLGSCYSHCTVYEVRACSGSLLWVNTRLDSSSVEGWVELEDMHVYNLEGIEWEP